MKILVTGATGFIGNYVVEELLKNNENEVITTSTTNHSGVPFDLKDFDNEINYFEFFGSPDKVIHLAWEGLPNYKEAFHVELNLPQHIAFLNNLIENGLKDLTITGTCLEYGMKEGCLTEAIVPNPSNPYAIAKDNLRVILELLQTRYEFNLKWLRLFYMYGKGQNCNSLISQLDRALENNEKVFNMSGGQQERDYLPVEKVAEYIVKIALQDKVTGIINCCSGRPITVKKFVLEYLNKVGKFIYLHPYYPYTDYEPMSFWGDDTKLRSIINHL